MTARRERLYDGPEDRIGCRIRLRHGPLVIEVRCPTAGDVEWLRENLRPAFDEDDSTPPAVTIVCQIDETLFCEKTTGSARIASSAEPPTPVPCFSMDGYVSAFPPSAGEIPGVFDTELDLVYLYDRRARIVSLIGRRYRSSLRIALLRLLRELAGGTFPQRSILTIHASALVLDGCGIVISGPKRTGKTTLLTHLLQSAGADYISNDRSLLQLDPDGSWLVSGIPTVISLRQDFSERLSLRVAPSVHRWLARETLARSGREGRTSPRHSGLSLSPAQYLEILGARSYSQVPLRAILFPEVARDGEGITLRRLEPDDAARRLHDASMPLRRTLFHQDVDEDEQRARDVRLCRQATTRHPAWSLRLGRDAYGPETRLGVAVKELLR